MTQQLPKFQIKAEDVAPTYRDLMTRIRAGYAAIKAETTWTYDSFDAVDKVNEEFGRFSSELSHMISVLDLDNSLRDAHDEMIPELTEFGSEIGQDIELYKILKALSEQDVTATQKRYLDKEMIDFKHMGIDLPEEQQVRLVEISQKLSQLSSTFSQNVVEDALSRTIDLEDDSRLLGMPDAHKARFAAQAEGVEGVAYRIKTNMPDYVAVISYAEDRELRKQSFMDNNTIASKGKHDNTAIIKEILELRQEKAGLLDYDNFAEYSLSKKMAESPEQVIDFLQDLTEKAMPQYKVELQELIDFAIEKGISKAGEELEPWDAAFAGELLQNEKHNISMEEIRKHFVTSNVQSTLFKLINDLFGYQLEAVTDFETYHEDVELFKVMKGDELIAYIYSDLYARDGKRGGAWMSDYTDRSESLVPVAFVTCNFTPVLEGEAGLLSLDEVKTLFHEFGHALHHTLTTVTVKGLEGISGVPWDAVELPSTFMEFFCEKEEILTQMDMHVETGEHISKEQLASLFAAERDGAAMGLVRQMEFSLIDMQIHKEKGLDPYDAIDQFRIDNGLLPRIPETRFFNKFGHIFAGGYAAGYYSYKWADILASDIFASFDAAGVVSPELGKKYLETILSQGGSKEFMDMFREFKGAEPDPKPFLKYTGIDC